METSQQDKSSLISVMFLIAGTCIGGGMLALPVASGMAGFFPSIAMMVICYLTMTATGLLLIEASLWLPDGAHFISMSETLLGKWGKICSWILYLFISYASLVAYTAGGGLEIARLTEFLFMFNLGKALNCILFFVLFGLIIDLGANLVGRVNSILFTSMVVAYFAMVFTGLPEVEPQLLAYENWSISYMVIPLILTSFSYQTLAPSLTPMLKRDTKALRIALIGGTTITFFIYLIWQMLILGIVPAEGEFGLKTALINGQPATHFLGQAVDGRFISKIANFFAFFAIVTSFLGIGLGLFDFLADGLKIEKKGFGKIKLGLLIAIPTLLFAINWEQAFLYAMDLTGGFGDSILSGLFPIMMVWVGRYHMKKQENQLVPGGKPVLVLIALFFLLSLTVETLVQIGYIPSIFDVGPEISL